MNQSTTIAPAAAGFMLVFTLFYFAILVVTVAGFWKTFTKAGLPGWGAIIPIYNTYLLTQLARRPGWWAVLMFLPGVNVVVLIVMSIDIAGHFGKSSGYGVGLALLSPVFYAMLGFGPATYNPRGYQSNFAVPVAGGYNQSGFNQSGFNQSGYNQSGYPVQGAQYQPNAPASYPPGWYPYPDGSGQRWWDGSAWAPPTN